MPVVIDDVEDAMEAVVEIGDELAARRGLSGAAVAGDETDAAHVDQMIVGGELFVEGGRLDEQREGEHRRVILHATEKIYDDRW